MQFGRVSFVFHLQKKYAVCIIEPSDDDEFDGYLNRRNRVVEFFNAQSRYFQDQFDTRALADRIVEFVVHKSLSEDETAFIESRDFFYLSTVDKSGFPQCSYKGGTTGFVKVLDAETIAFPVYDGNGMYLSAGNIRENPHIGMLFIDHEDPRKLRLNGTAEVVQDQAVVSSFQEAELVVKVSIREAFMNCPRYIHESKRVKDSPHAPREGQITPMADWKQLEVMQDVLPAKDKQRLQDKEDA